MGFAIMQQFAFVFNASEDFFIMQTCFKKAVFTIIVEAQNVLL